MEQVVQQWGRLAWDFEHMDQGEKVRVEKGEVGEYRGRLQSRIQAKQTIFNRAALCSKSLTHSTFAQTGLVVWTVWQNHSTVI